MAIFYWILIMHITFIQYGTSIWHIIFYWYTDKNFYSYLSSYTT